MDPYAHLTPKPLHEQVPGAWNFVEPNPDRVMVLAVPQMEMRIRLSPEARDVLQDRCPGLFADQPILEREWRELEDALTEIMLPPQRWVTGLPRESDPPGRPGHSQLVAGGH